MHVCELDKETMFELKESSVLLHIAMATRGGYDFEKTCVSENDTSGKQAELHGTHGNWCSVLQIVHLRSREIK